MALFRLATKAFLLLWMILLPSTLAYHFNEQAGLVKGILVDYRIPLISGSALALTGFLISLTGALLTGKPETRAWLLKDLGRWGTQALLISFLLQVAIGLFQFRFQRSLLGYLPLGEVSFSDPAIVKGVFFSGQLYKLPYGTTAHPNVLAGFAVVTFLLVCAQQFMPISRGYRALLFLLAALICFLTQSLTASVALIAGSLILLAYGSRLTRIARILLVSLPLLSFLFLSLPQMVTHPNPSISRRAQLQQIAIKMVSGEPVMGIGWNNFTFKQEDYDYVPGPTRFLQPLHHSFLLLIVELGLLGWAINFLFHFFILRVHSLWLPAVSALVLISSFDHYPVTLTTGRMLLLLILMAAVLHRSRPKLLVI